MEDLSSRKKTSDRSIFHIHTNKLKNKENHTTLKHTGHNLQKLKLFRAVVLINVLLMQGALL